VSRSAQYDTQTGGRTYGSNMSATTAGGSSIDRSVSASDGNVYRNGDGGWQQSRSDGGGFRR
jgi:hypothetical protein